MDGEQLDNAALVDRLGKVRANIAKLSEYANRLEYEIIKRMETDGAKEIYHQDWQCTLIRPSPTYDIHKLKARLGEIMPPDIYSIGFEPAHNELVRVPDKFNMVRVNKWARDFGKPVVDALDAARLPAGKGKVKVVPREGKK